MRPKRTNWVKNTEMPAFKKKMSHSIVFVQTLVTDGLKKMVE